MREQQTLGRRIQEARKAAGLSQESLGERLGVSRQAVSKWEADAAVPELENLIAMSRIFGVTIGALLGAIMIYWVFGVDVMRKELETGRDKPLPRCFGFLAKYVYVGLSLLVVVLGILLGGIG